MISEEEGHPIDVGIDSEGDESMFEAPPFTPRLVGGGIGWEGGWLGNSKGERVLEGACVGE